MNIKREGKKKRILQVFFNQFRFQNKDNEFGHGALILLLGRRLLALFVKRFGYKGRFFPSLDMSH